MSKKARRRPAWKKRSVVRGSLLATIARALHDIRAGNYIETSWPEGADGPKIVTRYRGGVAALPHP